MARGAPPLLVAVVVFDLRLPTGAGTWAAFGVAVVLGITTSFAIRFIVSLLTFWTLDDRGLIQATIILVIIFSGMLLPLALFPPALAAVARALPFAALIETPARVLLGKVTAASLPAELARQLAWGVALLGAGRLVLARATRRVVVQGG